MPTRLNVEELRRDLHLEVKSQHFTPFFVNDLSQGNVLDGSTTQACGYSLDDLTLGRTLTLIDSDKILLSDRYSLLGAQVSHETRQVLHMDCWQEVIAVVNDRERSQVWMEGEPRPPEELVEDVVGFSMAERQAAAHDMHTEILVEFCGRDGQVLDMLNHLESWEGHTPLVIFISEVALAISELGVCPGEDR